MSNASSELFPGSGQMAALMRDLDWATTPLGPPSHWPQSLKTIVRVLLTSRFAMWMGWGKELTFLYNDAYAAMTLGAKHPWALGQKSSDVWAEIWPDIGPRIEHVLKTGEATWDENLRLFLERSGYPEETYHTFSYSPVTDDIGEVCGHLCVVTEQTERVIGDRRMALLRDTAVGIAPVNTEAELFSVLRTSLDGALDLPFTLTYVFDDEGTSAELVCRTGISADHPLAVRRVSADAAHPLWAWARADGALPTGVVDLRTNAVVNHGPWPKPSTDALVVSIAQQGQKRPAGVCIAALNPYRPTDDTYVSFVELLVGQVAAGLGSAKAYQNERRRVEALAEVDRAKTTFFSNVSHEFRTPLTLMVGPLEDLIADVSLPQGERDVLEVVYRNSLRLLKLVNTLLDFSRIEAGRISARFEPVDLAALTADLASTFRSAMTRAGLELRVECRPLTQPTYVDRDMWEKVVLNLMSNAFKFTMRGFITVRVREDRNRAVLEVEDSGVGIPEHELPHVFERFHRVEGAVGRSHEGSGIGLALVSELVKAHSGELRAESGVGQGSRFIVSIPLGGEHLRADQIVAPAATPVREMNPFAAEAMRWLPDSLSAPRADAPAEPGASGRPLDKAHVLLADDNADMRGYAQRLLSQHWSVDVVSNGRDALARARARRPDVIVTDVMMPVLDGFGLLRELRADAALQTIPVIMLSARAGEEARLEGLAASADDYLVKPFSARELLGRVEAQVIRSRERTLERAHAERLSNLLARVPVAIALLRGPDHVYELTNARYIELVGGRTCLGKPVREALPEVADQGAIELLDMVRRTGQPFVGQSMRFAINRGPLGQAEDAYFDFVYQPTFDALGNVDTIVVAAHDVTSLAQAKAEAETANRLKDEFLATLSHELRTPLNAVLGYVQMLRNGLIAGDRVPAVLDTIERNAQLQEQLVNDVLDVSRIITGKLRLDVRPVSLAGVITDAIETVTPAATAKGVRLQSALDQPGVPVAGDAQRLQQVVWNVLSNAVKFTPRGGRVQIRLQRINSHVEITVADTGEGIAPAFLPQLFQRFTQGDGSYTRTHSGLGLGLAISRHLVEAHGGVIEAFSPGKGLGTTIRIELPLMIIHDDKAAADDRVHPAGDGEITPRGAMTDLSGLRVLLVDDDLDALNMARDALALSGADVVTAHGAIEALETLDGERFDAAVFDIGMPETDGYELLKRLRDREAGRQGYLPALALTAYARSVDRTRSLQAGFQMHLTKPVRPAELAAAVASLAKLSAS